MMRPYFKTRSYYLHKLKNNEIFHDKFTFFKLKTLCWGKKKSPAMKQDTFINKSVKRYSTVM